MELKVIIGLIVFLFLLKIFIKITKKILFFFFVIIIFMVIINYLKL